jgi:hypothetical protein
MELYGKPSYVIAGVNMLEPLGETKPHVTSLW